MKATGAKYAHNVYKFVKNLVRKTADVTSAHFIENVKKWRAEAEDVAAAVKKKAADAVKDLGAQAARLAAIFADKPELMDAPEQAAKLAGVPDSTPTAPEPVHTSPVEWEDGDTWEDAPAEPAPPATGKIAPLPDYCQKQTPHVYASWRERVPGYQKTAAAA